jgi:hypothetical protein
MPALSPRSRAITGQARASESMIWMNPMESSAARLA